MKRFEERRRLIRLEVPLEIKYILEGKSARKEVTTKDISCEGLRFVSNDDIREGVLLEIDLIVPNAPNPVHANGKTVWVKRLATENGSPFEVGVEFTKIEEDNKNTFLRYLCNLIYDQTKIMERRKT